MRFHAFFDFLKGRFVFRADFLVVREASLFQLQDGLAHQGVVILAGFGQFVFVSLQTLHDIAFLFNLGFAKSFSVFTTGIVLGEREQTDAGKA
jgi:hypothetical protein